MIKKALASLLASVMLLSLAACKQNEEAIPSGTEPTTESVADEMEHFNLNEIDLAGIGELLAERDQDSYSEIQLDGLCTPVILELEGTDVETVTAYGTTVCVAEEAKDYNSIYGNLWPVIYEQDGLIFLNIWHDDIGYSCVLCPDGTFMENYPSGDFSVMIYVDEEGRMCQYQFARKFLGIEQWDTGPIDMATSRDDFYYSIDDAAWTEEEYSVTSREYYTISDCFELDEIFSTAKANGLYPDIETLDELLDYNYQRFLDAEHTDDPSYGPDSVREETGFFDQTYAAWDYDGQHNLLCETFYDLFGEEYFTKTHTYDAQNREVAGSWCFKGEEVYRYTNTYNKNGLITETVWYQGNQEAERFTYTYNSKGSYTKTFSQKGKKKYTYTFDGSGELTAHSVYEDGKEIQTKDVKGLVKTELLTDIWFPFMDNGALHFNHHYDGTTPMEAPANAEVITAADGSYIMVTETVDDEDGTHCQHEYHYNAQNNLLQAIHSSEGVEYLRDVYQYNSKGLPIQQITYIDGEQSLSREYQYNGAGQLIQMDRTPAEPEIEYIHEYDETGMEVSRGITYNTRTETYRYNDLGLLVETVVYADGEEFRTDTYDYDANGYVLPSTDTYQYVYDAEGRLEGIWLIYEDHAAGMALLRSHTVYVTPENARQLQEIMRNELSWF